jgi:hypothetical protein
LFIAYILDGIDDAEGVSLHEEEEKEVEMLLIRELKDQADVTNHI